MPNARTDARTDGRTAGQTNLVHKTLVFLRRFALLLRNPIHEFDRTWTPHIIDKIDSIYTSAFRLDTYLVVRDGSIWVGLGIT